MSKDQPTVIEALYHGGHPGPHRLEPPQVLGPFLYGVQLSVESRVVGLLVLDGWDVSQVEWSLLLLYQSTQPAVAYSTSARVLYGPEWKTVVRMHSGL